MKNNFEEKLIIANRKKVKIKLNLFERKNFMFKKFINQLGGYFMKVKIIFIFSVCIFCFAFSVTEEERNMELSVGGGVYLNSSLSPDITISFDSKINKNFYLFSEYFFLISDESWVGFSIGAKYYFKEKIDQTISPFIGLMYSSWKNEKNTSGDFLEGKYDVTMKTDFPVLFGLRYRLTELINLKLNFFLFPISSYQIKSVSSRIELLTGFNLKF